MNEYGFDYMNYITSVPKNMNYNQLPQTNNSFSMTKHMNPHKNITQQTTDPMQGFIRGNLFTNLYDPYKNYKPMELNPKNEQQTLLYQVMQYQFALTELNLYLDTNPNDTEALNLYQQYLQIEKQMRNRYESMYGPLTISSDSVTKNNWAWNNSPWPWEGV